LTRSAAPHPSLSGLNDHLPSITVLAERLSSPDLGLFTKPKGIIMFHFSSFEIANFIDSLTFFVGAVCGGLYVGVLLDFIMTVTGVA
jgi:hypothetical protein